jgi:hypothetical protein
MQKLCEATRGAEGTARLCGFKVDASTGKESDAIFCTAPNPLFKKDAHCGAWEMKGGMPARIFRRTARVFLNKAGETIRVLRCVVAGEFAGCGANICDGRMLTPHR